MHTQEFPACEPGSNLPGDMFITGIVFIYLPFAFLFEKASCQIGSQDHANRKMGIRIKGLYFHITDGRPHRQRAVGRKRPGSSGPGKEITRSEEHTSELQ